MAVKDPTPSIESIHIEIAHLAEIVAYVSEALADLRDRLDRALRASPVTLDFCAQRDHNRPQEARRP